MRRGTTRSYEADVKPSRREPFRPAGFTAHGRNTADARNHFARIFNIPERWVRVKGAA